MAQAGGFEKNGCEHLVYKLKKALYGLRQSSPEWNAHLDKFSLEMKCEKINAVPTFCIPRRENKVVIMIVYLDNVAMFVNEDTIMQFVMDKFSSDFQLILEQSLPRYPQSG